ncbi:BLUF domain-containing protein [Hellea balneolensis]|uniref:BLUF domain-containing protein n=1 Tax=Hellea balneolensis TaxID=287478 RepID=UPI0004066512|nr:BLUF domain-containing protein [Hellea balneolensis]
MLSQMIYTSTSAPHVTLEDKVNVASYSVATCDELGLTGRVLVVPEMAINVLEGPEAIVSAYVAAIRDDALIDLLIVHNTKAIEEHEFDDYSVWMTYKPDETPIRGVYRLTPDNFEQALPKNLPLKTRLFIEANFADHGLEV